MLYSIWLAGLLVLLLDLNQNQYVKALPFCLPHQVISELTYSKTGLISLFFFSISIYSLFMMLPHYSRKHWTGIFFWVLTQKTLHLSGRDQQRERQFLISNRAERIALNKMCWQLRCFCLILDSLPTIVDTLQDSAWIQSLEQ